jgi:hypothetical protein
MYFFFFASFFFVLLVLIAVDTYAALAYHIAGVS